MLHLIAGAALPAQLQGLEGDLSESSIHFYIIPPTASPSDFPLQPSLDIIPLYLEGARQTADVPPYIRLYTSAELPLSEGYMDQLRRLAGQRT